MFVGSDEINEGMEGSVSSNPGGLCAGGQTDLHLRDLSEVGGISGHEASSSWEKPAGVTPIFWSLDQSFLNDFCGT